MAVVETDTWLERYMEKKNKAATKAEILEAHQKQISDRLTAYFPNASSMEIYYHLLQNGLFTPSDEDETVIEAFNDKAYWAIIRSELQVLQEDWNGPDVPVFLLPSDPRNRKLHADFNGLSGLSFHNKVFLFVAEHNKSTELRKLLTHEYNHVCRLHHLDKREDGMNLLDSLILEGLAEMAVKERLGVDHVAKWATLYSERNALDHWNKWLKSNRVVKKTEHRHDELLYGRGFVPRWAGYNAGFHIVSSYLKNSGNSIEKTLHVPAETILGESDFSAS